MKKFLFLQQKVYENSESGLEVEDELSQTATLLNELRQLQVLLFH